ncbi:MAG TPA: hypothetical protein VIH42_05605 [Thermoguttaceae bacterium]
MIDTPLGILLAMFQEDRYFWAVADDELRLVECRFCGAKFAGRPENLPHNDGCVIELAARMIQSDTAFRSRVKNSPPRPVFKGTARLTVWRKGQWLDAR